MQLPLPIRGRIDVARLRAHPAFTVIELLVVVAILALLAAILLPGLAAAREQGRRARCAANLRSLAHGWHLYVEDRAGFPVEAIGSPLNVWLLHGGKRDMLCTEFENVPRPRPLNEFVAADETQAETTAHLRCPSDTGVADVPDTIFDGATWYDFFGNSYPTNSGLLGGGRHGGGFRQLRRPLRFEEFTVPPAVVVMIGDAASAYGGNPAPPLRMPWHDSTGRRANVAFADGSVRFITFVPGQAQSGQYRYRWSSW